MPDITDLHPGNEAVPGTPGTDENVCPARSGTSKVIESIGGG
ncbi:hypothetical protein [Caballeronia sp. SEWSISQ10-4 2]|nr:hypothetical protein [Caballeronia sp. SEWSISQ10-4 2]